MEDNKKDIKQKERKVSRREFIGGAASAAAFTIVPRYVLGGNGYTPPSEKLNIAGIGVGGMGAHDIAQVGSENIVALCDVDESYAAGTFKRYPKAKKYRDFRKMLEKQKNIDAVVIATPDHTHAVIAMMAMKMGKHVYCEKPLTHTVYEARKLTEAAREYKVATQMGNQGHSGEGIRLTVEWIRAGAIGPVRHVYAWTSAGGWEWTDRNSRPQETPPVPSTLDWNRWLGPAPYRPYHPAYAPYRWRGWWDFGTGGIGDMACHNIDPAFWALKLGEATNFSVEASSTALNDETVPTAAIYHYKFPARGEMPAVTLTWYDGGLMPPRPKELEEGREMGANGIYFVGDDGVIKCPGWGGAPRIIPETKMKAYKRPPKTIARTKEHHQDWLGACKAGKPACSNFNYAGPLTELVLLGNVALRTGKKLYWDWPNMKAINAPEADKYIRLVYRKGWGL